MAGVRRVKVGPLLYDVEEVEDLRSSGKGKSLWGKVDHVGSRVLVRAENAVQQKRHTLWHEIVHLVLMQAGRRKDSRKERLVDVLAYSLMQVVEDNPWLAEPVVREEAVRVEEDEG